MLALGATDTSGALRSRTGARSHDNIAPLSVSGSHTNAGVALTRVEECEIHLVRSLRIR